MSSLVNSKAFDNFVLERSEEILCEEKEYQEINKRILEKQKVIVEKISTSRPVTYEEFSAFESEMISLISCTKKVLYKKIYEIIIKPTL